MKLVSREKGAREWLSHAGMGGRAEAVSSVPDVASTLPCNSAAELAPSNFRNAAHAFPLASPAPTATPSSLFSACASSPVAAPLDPPSVFSTCTRDGRSSPRYADNALQSTRLPSSIRLRPILLSDLEALQKLHEEIFPITYEQEFFLCVVYHKGVLSWGACRAEDPENLIGFVTARMMPPSEVEMANILEPLPIPLERTLMYILTLGVQRQFRKSGVASALVQKVVDEATRTPWCQGVYLHVVDYNVPAIRFYKRLEFTCVRKDPSFYLLEGRFYDAYVFVRYLNGGQPCSWTLSDWVFNSTLSVRQGCQGAPGFGDAPPALGSSCTDATHTWVSAFESIFKPIYRMFMAVPDGQGRLSATHKFCNGIPK